MQTILIVDDEVAVRRFTRGMLQHVGFQVLEARDGQDALEVAATQNGPIHLLLTDVAMPRMDGFQLARQLRTQRPETRVLFFSGMMEDVDCSDEWKEAPFLRKPFTFAELTTTIGRVIRNSPR